MFLTACFFNNDLEPAPDAIVDQTEVLKFTPTILDTFTDSNNTSIASHTADQRPNSNTWSQTVTSSFYIQNNSLQPNRQSNADIAVIDSGLSDLSIMCDVTPFDNSGNIAYPGMVFRYVDASNYWYVFPDTANSHIEIYQVNAGVSIHKSEYTIALTSGTQINLRIDCIGNNIVLYLNGTEILTVVDSFNSTATKVGVRYGKVGTPASACIWDNFKVVPFNGQVFNWPLFTEYVSNPIASLGAGGSWEASDLNDPNVVFDPVAQEYVLFYSGYKGTGARQALGLSYSNTLPGSWVKEPTNPVFGGDLTNIQNGGVVYFNNQWFYYFGDGSSINIRLAKGATPLTLVDQGIVLSPNTSNYWEVTRVFDAFARVTQDGKTVQLWYAARNDADQINSINLATSTDGITFTKSPLNPIYRQANIRGEPSVFVPNGKEGQEMLINFDFGGVVGYRMIDQILSVDGGNTWHRRSNALSGSGAGWESNQVFDPFIFPTILANIMYLFHSGANTSGGGLNLNSEIGVASASWPYTSFKK